MDKNLESALAELVGSINSATDFVVEQAPDVIQQLLTFSLFENILAMVVSIVILSVIVHYVLNIKWDKKEEWKYFGMEMRSAGHLYMEGKAIVLNFVYLILALIFVPCLLFSIVDIVKILIAPKLWLLQYASLIMK